MQYPWVDRKPTLISQYLWAHRHQDLMFLIHKLLRILWSLRPYENRRIHPHKVCHPISHTARRWVLPLNIRPVDLVTHGLGLHSDGMCHLGQRYLHLRTSQPNRVNWHSSLFSWSLGWNPIVPNSYSSSHLTNVPPSIHSMKTMRIDVRNTHNTMKSNIN